jgi:hypothetical protein
MKMLFLKNNDDGIPTPDVPTKAWDFLPKTIWKPNKI